MVKKWAQSPVTVVLGLILLFSGIYAGHRLLFPALPLVGVIQWTSETRSFEDCLQGVTDGLREEGFQDGLNIRLEVKNIQGKREAAAAATQDFRKRGASLLITLGTVPTRIALEATQGSDIPIVYANVGAPEATGSPGSPPLHRHQHEGAGLGTAPVFPHGPARHKTVGNLILQHHAPRGGRRRGGGAGEPRTGPHSHQAYGF